MSWGDFWTGLGNVGSFVGNVAPVAFGAYNLFNRPDTPSYQGPPPGAYQQQAPAFDMEGFNEMMREWMGGFGEMMSSQQEALRQEQQKGLARQASSARKGMQAQGVTWDPNDPTAGAGGVYAIASQMGIPPEELLEALTTYGGEFGFTGFGPKAG